MVSVRNLLRIVLAGLIGTVVLAVGIGTAHAEDFPVELPDGAVCYSASLGIQHTYNNRTYLCRVQFEQDGDTYYEWKDISNGADYRAMRRSDTNLCWGLAGGSTGNGVPIVQGPCNLNDHTQWWAQEGNYDGFGLLINYHSGKCVSVANNSQGSNAPLVQQPCANNHAMFWNKAAVGSTWKFQNYHSGLLLSVPSGSTASGKQLDQYRDVGSADQHWSILPLP